MFDDLWSQFDLHYSYFGVRGVDWNAMRDKYRPLALAAQSDGAFALALGDMVMELLDLHVSITPGTGATMRWVSSYERQPSGFNATASFSRYATTSTFTTGHLRGGITSTGVGYIQIPSFEGDGWAGEMDDALSRLNGVTSLVIDVRNNQGGSKTVAQSVAGRFADRQRTTGYVRLRNGPGHDDFSSDIAETVQPEGTHFSGPVVVLTNRRSMSSAEDFILAMRAIPGNTIMGDTTAGASGGPLIRELANGWTYQMSQWIAYTADHKTFEGVGLAPDVVVKPSAAALQASLNANDAPLERAIATLAKP
jgi:C-terminal processing protease CtpA/Prc